MKQVTKEVIVEKLKLAIKSCEEGESGQWDTSTDEGKEGFGAIADDLQYVLRGISKLKAE